MVSRTRPRAATLRDGIPWRAYDAIVRRTCYHLDAWVMQATDDSLYLVLEARVGGTLLVDRRTYRLAPDGLTPCEDIRDGIARHIDSPWARRNAPWLNALHWRYVQPVLRIPREGFKGHTSVKLHYVWSDKACDDPCEGMTNLYAETGRAARDGYMHTGAPISVATPDAPAWDKRERSVLRTLDKLLKGNIGKTD